MPPDLDCDDVSEDSGFAPVDECLAIYSPPDGGSTREAISSLLRDLACVCQREGLDFLALAKSIHIPTDALGPIAAAVVLLAGGFARRV